MLVLWFKNQICVVCFTKREKIMCTKDCVEKLEIFILCFVCAIFHVQTYVKHTHAHTQNKHKNTNTHPCGQICLLSLESQPLRVIYYSTSFQGILSKKRASRVIFKTFLQVTSGKHKLCGHTSELEAMFSLQLSTLSVFHAKAIEVKKKYSLCISVRADVCR